METDAMRGGILNYISKISAICLVVGFVRGWGLYN